ncbi:MAG: glycosyl transferase [Phycisphaerales bacterium]|jgi:biofilm PGA synthesis N-glycosyltransferase PgaC|nr:glycosyl transferase [Phycisphaerales bacterium]
MHGEPALWFWAFWLCAACVVYAYVAYPLFIFAVSAKRGRPVRLGPARVTSVSVVIAAHNEQASIGRRMRELAAMVTATGLEGEVIVVSDGSTDATADIARKPLPGAAPPVRVVELPSRQGKAAALNAGCAASRGEVIVFADTRQTWAADALAMLLRNFADPTIGAVGGELVVETAPGVMAGVGMYWRFEKWLRRQESRVHSTVGLTGAIAAVRRKCFQPIPPGTILDDVYWPLRVVMQGFRVVHEGEARAFDRLPDRPRDEFRRKVRTLSSNFQLVTRLPAALLPWRNPVWFQFISHKLLRLAVPWALLALLVSSAMLNGAAYHALLAAQLGFYGAALYGMWHGSQPRMRIAAAAASFVVLNAAAFLAFWVWASGNAGRSWTKVTYTSGPPGAA